MLPFLKRPRLLLRCLHFDESHPSAWKKYDPVWHPVCPRGHELWTHAAYFLYCLNERLLDIFLSHILSLFHHKFIVGVKVMKLST